HILTTRPSISIGTRSRTCLQAQGLAPHRNPLRLVRHNFFSALCNAAAVMLFEGMGPGCCSRRGSDPPVHERDANPFNGIGAWLRRRQSATHKFRRTATVMEFRHRPGRIRISSALAILVGLSVTTYLFVATGPAVVIGLLFDASYGVAVVIGFHVSQILFDALAWQALLGAVTRPRLRIFMVLRWIREATNNLLPVAQIGGEVVGARLLSLFGVGMAEAAASTAVDLTLEMLSQV